jgi:tetratricopeptide (TPR) repeat protein
LNEVPGLVADALSRIARFPEREGEAHFLLGSAYLALAQKMPEERARETSMKARQHLEQAEALSVPDEDRDSLIYRLAKCWSYTDGNPAKICDYLSRSIETGADDRFEGYGLLTQAFLRLPVPDIKRALAANERQLQLPAKDENALAPVKLLRGELLLRLQQREEARKVLTRVGRNGASDVLIRVRSLLARTYLEDQNWKEAAELWEGLVADAKHLPADAGSIYYWLGLCYLHLNRPGDAERAWQKALRGKGEAGQAAALRLAEVRLMSGTTRGAVELLEQALETVPRFGDYHNVLLDAGEARAIVDMASHRYQEVREYATAQKVALLHAKLSPLKQARILWAQVTESWGRAERDKAQALRDKQAMKALERTASDHFLDAAAAFYQAAGGENAQKSDESDLLWQAAQAYLEGNDPGSAVAVLDRLVRLPGSRERISEAWYRLGEAQQSLTNSQAARYCYGKSIECGGRFAYLSRYQLAQMEIALGHFEDAERQLSHNLELTSPDENSEAFEKSQYLLANLLFMWGKYQPAAARFELALERFRTNPGAAQARFRLGECYRLLAEKETLSKSQDELPMGSLPSYFRNQRNHYLEKADATYQMLANDLDARRHSGGAPLTEEETDVLRRALFAMAECRFNLQDYDQALRIYENLASLYKHQYEGLLACRELFNCHLVMLRSLERGSLENARDALKSAKSICNELDDGAFKDRPGAMSRQDWEQWIKGAEAKLRDLAF